MASPATALDWLSGQEGLEAGAAEAALQAAAGSPLEALNMYRAGATDQYRLLTATLEELRSGRMGAGAAMAALSEIDPDSLWSWISLLTSGKLKSEIREHQLARELSILQSLADHNRRLVATPVRKDFLLQDWLIQWARLSA